MVKRLLIIFMLALMASGVQAQGCFATVVLDRRSVYVQQPFKVTVTVLTTTWFTAPVEFDNVQVPNAFVLPFGRNYPGMFNHKGKQYPGIQFHVIVFPYSAGEFTLPSIVVHATTPPEGSSESRRTTIRTPAVRYVVKAIPVGVKDGWFVARSATIHEHWNKSLATLKVGDVIERTVTVYARGTLPQFIPALQEPPLDFANVYPQDPELKDLRDDNDANGQLTQTFIYLMEREGSFTIPPMELRWWNPDIGRTSTRSLPQHRIIVHDNPDLGMVASIRDSLNATQTASAAVKAKSPRTILGMKWYVFLPCALVALLLLIFIYHLIRKLVGRIQQSLSDYRKSEKYWFGRLRRASSGNFWRRLYEWWNHVGYDQKDDGLVQTMQKSGDSEGERRLRQVNAGIYDKERTKVDDSHSFTTRLATLRKWLTLIKNTSADKIADRQREWLR